MNRRNFLTTAAGATGYSMFIRVDGLAAEQEQAEDAEIGVIPCQVLHDRLEC